MFGWQPPLFAHLPLLLNADKSKLSKRQGDVAVEDYEKKGYLPEAMLNFVAFLGWNPGGEKELFTLDEMVKEFSFEKVNKAGGVFNLEKLDWYNREYMKRMNNEELSKVCRSLIVEKYGIRDYELGIMGRVVGLEKERATTLVELVDNVKFVFGVGDYSGDLLVWKKSDRVKTKENLTKLSDFLATLSDFSKDNLQIRVGEWVKENGLTNGDVLWPMRVAMSGQENSPGPFEIAEVLGREETLDRINIAVKKL